MTREPVRLAPGVLIAALSLLAMSLVALIDGPAAAQSNTHSAAGRAPTPSLQINSGTTSGSRDAARPAARRGTVQTQERQQAQIPEGRGQR